MPLVTVALTKQAIDSINILTNRSCINESADALVEVSKHISCIT